MSASEDISEQLEEMTEKSSPPIVPFLPTYRRESFSNLGPPSADERPFRVLYVGRIEATKGVFDCLEIAKRFKAVGREDIVFDLCGEGSAMQELRTQVEDEGLGERFRCHGHCTRNAMRQMYESSYVVIAPTRTDLVEGFNQVLVEAILASRPVISSEVCPAIRYVREAAVQVEPNDVQAYGDGILRLVDDPEFYEEKRRACAPMQERFYDPGHGWAAALRRILTGATSKPTPQP
jgi:glycosyltransferase involved in cell wall biosynthesis